MEDWEQPKCQIPAFNIMTIRTRCQTNVSKQTTLLDGVDIGMPKQRVCWRGLKSSVHEAMKCKGSFKDSQWKCKYFLMKHPFDETTLI